MLSMFVEGNGRIDTLVKIFAFFPEKSIRYIAKKRGKVITRFLVMEGSSGAKSLLL